MPLEVVYEKYVNPNKNKLPDIPTIIKWHDVPFIRSHSIRACAREILDFSRTIEVVNVSIIGNQGTGKTTFASTLAHIIHSYSTKEDKIPFAVKMLDRDDLANFSQVIKELTPTNWIICFDDVSFLSAQNSKRQIDTIKHGLTEIRHLQEKDIRVILIFNYHYSFGLDKYIRGGNYKFYTSIGSSETENVSNTVGKKYIPLIDAFQRITNHAIVRKKWRMRLGKKGHFEYEYRKPFIPLLFYNGSTMRFAVSPTRQFIDPVCSICDNSKKKKVKSNVDLVKYAKQIQASFGPKVAKQALRVILHANGIDRKSVV